MEKLVLDIPLLYADHHTVAVRRILEGLPGISDLYVSSAFHQVSLNYDPAQVSKEQIVQALEEYGYLQEGPQLAFADRIYRHEQRRTAALAGTAGTVAFIEPAPPIQERPRMPTPDLDLLAKE
jgi:copper chaperone CopZ